MERGGARENEKEEMGQMSSSHAVMYCSWINMVPPWSFPRFVNKTLVKIQALESTLNFTFVSYPYDKPSRELKAESAICQTKEGDEDLMCPF